MTQDEKAHLIGALTIETNALQHELTCLRAKARRMEQQLLEAASEAGRYARTDPESFIGATTHPAIVTPSSDEIQCVIVEIQETANKLDRKQHELRELSQAV